MNTTTWKTWRGHFEANAGRPLPEVEAPALPAEQHARLLESLRKFQLGESGEGRLAHEIDHATFGGIDADYRVALKLFIAEEGRHARILGRMVGALGGRVLTRQWSERVFVHLRRALGIRFKLVVLQAAEVIGIAFYGLLAGALPAGKMADALRQICGDETAHLQFHRDFFASQGGTVAGWALRAVWWPIGTAAAAALLWDQRKTLRAFGVPLRTAWRALWSRVVEAAQKRVPLSAQHGEVVAVHRLVEPLPAQRGLDL